MIVRAGREHARIPRVPHHRVHAPLATNYRLHRRRSCAGRAGLASVRRTFGLGTLHPEAGLPVDRLS
jgi:hypothetical protein